jgi:hypothetical protein
MPLDLRHEASKSHHRWNIRLDSSDRDRLQDITEDVDNATKSVKSIAKNFVG